MENQEMKQQQEEMYKEWEKTHRRGRAFGGILIVIAGSLFLAKELGAELPHWLFSWKMLLIAIGLVVCIKHRFSSIGGFIMMLIGGAFLLGDIYPTLVIRPLLWPVLIIMVGLFVIFKPSNRNKCYQQHHLKKKQYKDYYRYKQEQSYDKSTVDSPNLDAGNASSEDVLATVTVMGSVKKNIVSKDFKGGEMVVVFGGAELNLSQADFNEKITLEIVQVFGGTRLIIPANWEVKSELVSVFGSIEDSRAIQPTTVGANKILLLKGNTFFGGIEIKSY